MVAVAVEPGTTEISPRRCSAALRQPAATRRRGGTLGDPGAVRWREAGRFPRRHGSSTDRLAHDVNTEVGAEVTSVEGNGSGVSVTWTDQGGVERVDRAAACVVATPGQTTAVSCPGWTVAASISRPGAQREADPPEGRPVPKSPGCEVHLLSRPASKSPIPHRNTVRPSRRPAAPLPARGCSPSRRWTRGAPSNGTTTTARYAMPCWTGLTRSCLAQPINRVRDVIVGARSTRRSASTRSSTVPRLWIRTGDTVGRRLPGIPEP